MTEDQNGQAGKVEPAPDPAKAAVHIGWMRIQYERIATWCRLRAWKLLRVDEMDEGLRSVRSFTGAGNARDTTNLETLPTPNRRLREL